jgi:RecA-family ATPase
MNVLLASNAELDARAQLNMPPLDFIDIRQWCEHPPPQREWAVFNRFPLRQVALLSGEGAIGKSIVLMQLCAAHALGRDWLDAMPEPGPTIYIGCEDEADELHRRMVGVMAYYGAPMSDLTGRFYAISLAGQDTILASPSRSGIIQPTPLFARLQEAACDIKPKLIGLDTAADIFGGQENDRAQVRQFITLLRGMAIRANSTILICSHPSITGINTGTGLSGSTGWHNSVRARAYRHAVKTQAGEEPDPELRELEFMKNNYGPIAERILLRWKGGVFVPEPGANSVEKLVTEQKADDLFLTLLGQFDRQGRNVSEKPNSPTYAPTAFSKESVAKTAGLRRDALADAMRRLFAAEKIRVENYGRPARPASRLVKT